TRHGLSVSTIYARLTARERVASTALGYAVAIPHARIDGVQRPVAAFVRTHAPVAFDAPDNAGVTDMLVLIVPEQATEEHLSLLAEVARIFSDDALRSSLRSCLNAEAIHATLAGDMSRNSVRRSNVMESTNTPTDPAARWFCPEQIAIDLDVRDSLQAVQA